MVLGDEPSIGLPLPERSIVEQVIFDHLSKKSLSAANRHQNTEQLLQSHPLHEIKTRNFILSRVILCVFLTPTSLNKQLDRPTFSTSIVRPVNSYTHDMTMLNTACRLAHKRKTGDYRSSIISVTTMAVIT